MFLWRAGSVGEVSEGEVERGVSKALGLDQEQRDEFMADLWAEYLGSLNLDLRLDTRERLESFFCRGESLLLHILANLGPGVALAKAPIEVDTAGVRLLGPAPDTGETACQVCGEELVGAVVRCTSCGTHHHRDCWAFSGLCSTYACGSTVARPYSGQGRSGCSH